MRRFVLALVLTGCGVEPTLDETEISLDSVDLKMEASRGRERDLSCERGHMIRARAVFTDDFDLDPNLFASPDPAAAAIERDRLIVGDAAVGLVAKRLPVGFGPQGVPYSGGRWLFDTYEHAVAFQQWLTNEYRPDGVPFYERWYFIDPLVYSHELIGGWRWQDIEEQAVLRTERWTVDASVPAHVVRAFLRGQWPVVKQKAERRGYSEVWLSYAPSHNLVSITYYDDRADPSWDRSDSDFASLEALASDPSMVTQAMAHRRWTKVMDRTQWVFVNWSPYLPGDSGEPSTWPNSPPLPGLASGDGLCVPSQGESSSNSPDCLPTCGNAVADPGETVQACPSDVRIY